MCSSVYTATVVIWQPPLFVYDVLHCHVGGVMAGQTIGWISKYKNCLTKQIYYVIDYVNKKKGLSAQPPQMSTCTPSWPCMIPYSLSWSLFCSLHSRSSCRTCCCGVQAFFSLSRLLRSTLRPGRLSSSRSRGTEDSRSDARDWKTASSQRVTSGKRPERQEKERNQGLGDTYIGFIIKKWKWKWKEMPNGESWETCLTNSATCWIALSCPHIVGVFVALGVLDM